jgi:hypothetical protein
VPVYFFDLHNDTDALDDEGKDLPDFAAAKTNALSEAREMIKTSLDETGRIDLSHHIDVRDQSGAILYVIRFEDAVTVQRGEWVLSRASNSAS